MKEYMWRKIDHIFGLLLIGVVFGLMVFLANVEVKDLDLWLHLGMGRYIVHTGHVPSVDILSCSIAGQPWVNHEWLFQVIVYLLYSSFGFDGLIMMQVVLVCVTLLILTILAFDQDKNFLVGFSLLLVLMVYQMRFTIRPDLYSLLFFALYIFILSLFIDRKWSTYALFFIQVLWSNLHGFFFFGPLFVFIGLSAEWIKRHIKLPWEWNEAGRLTDDEYRRLGKILFFVTLACLINPLGIKGAWYPIRVFFELSGESKIFFQHIQELQKPILWNTIFNVSELIYYKVMILLSAISFVFNRRRIDIGSLFFWMIFLVFSLMAVRNIPFFAFAAYLVIVTNFMPFGLDDILPVHFIEKKFQYVTAISLKILLIIWILNYGLDVSAHGYFDFDKFERKSALGGVSLNSYPNKAVDFIIANNIRGNAFNDFNSGAYLVGRCFPGIRVFIDGRTEVYGPQFFNNYQKIYKGDMEEFKKKAEDLNITVVLLNSAKQSIPKGILKKLYDDEEWILVYLDYDGVIFLKDVPQHKEVIDRFAIDVKKWKVQPVDLLRLGAKRVKPYRPIHRAFILEILGGWDASIAEAQEAWKINPTYTDVYKILGKVYSNKKSYKNAFENFRIVTLLDPGSREARINLAQAYYDLEEYGYAVYQYQKLIDHRPNDVGPYFFMSRAYIKDKKYEAGIKVLRKAHAMDPKDLHDVLAIGDIFVEEQQYDYAKEAYEMALATKKDEAKVRSKLGILFKDMGKIEEARQQFEKGLEVDSDCEELKKNLKEL